MKYLSLFSGIGGLEYGLRNKAKCIGISEIKNSSVRIYKRNYGEVYNIGDITKVEINRLVDFDGLLGGFPCQSFSLAGLRKGFEDKRGKMIFYIYDILKIKKEVMGMRSELVKLGKDLNGVSHHHGSLTDVSTHSVKTEVLDEMRSKIHWYNIF